MKGCTHVGVLCWIVSDSWVCDELDLPELTSIQLGSESMLSEYGCNDSSEFILRSTISGWL